MSKDSYASSIGSLMYAILYSRADIDHVVGFVSQFLSNTKRIIGQFKVDIEIFEKYFQSIFIFQQWWPILDGYMIQM